MPHVIDHVPREIDSQAAGFALFEPQRQIGWRHTRGIEHRRVIAQHDRQILPNSIDLDLNRAVLIAVAVLDDIGNALVHGLHQIEGRGLLSPQSKGALFDKVAYRFQIIQFGGDTQNHAWLDNGGGQVLPNSVVG